jgi:hypothetical protein
MALSYVVRRSAVRRHVRGLSPVIVLTAELRAWISTWQDLDRERDTFEGGYVS